MTRRHQGPPSAATRSIRSSLGTTPGATVLALVCGIAGALAAARPAPAAPGVLDPTFGDGGIVSTPIPGAPPGFEAGARALVVQPDGRIVAGGSNSTLIRYDPDGSLDPTFGAGGIVIGDLGGDIYALALQPDGRILAAGACFTVARYLPDGTLDAAFGTGGMVMPGSDCRGFVTAIALQPDGRIVVGGSDSLQYDDAAAFVVARYASDGTPDPSFGDGGVVTTDLTSLNDQLNDLALQPDGKIIAVGGQDGFAAQDFALVRYEADGTLDTSFGSGGVVRTHPSIYGNHLNGVALQPDGKIVAAGHIFTYPDGGAVMARYNPDGSLDPAFGASGVTAPLGLTGGYELYDVALQPDGRIVAAGQVYGLVVSDAAVARYHPDGTVDTTFPSAGTIRKTTTLADDEWATAIALQSDGKIVVAVPSSCWYDPPCAFTLLRLAPAPCACPACETCDGAGGCIPAPQGGCRVPVEHLAAELDLAHGPHVGEQSFRWDFRQGEVTMGAMLGDPLRADSYSFCIYDESGPTPQLAFRAAAPAGRPRWSGRTRRYRYWDRDGSSAGLRKMVLIAGGYRQLRYLIAPPLEARIVVKGRSPAIDLPLPLPLPARVQVQSENGECWEATYAPGGVARNDGEAFQGSGGAR